MMAEWARSLVDIEAQSTAALLEYWKQLIPGWSVSPTGVASLRKWAAKHGLSSVMEAMKIAVDRYVGHGPAGIVPSSVQTAWAKVPGILHIRQQEAAKPWMADLYHARNIARRRCGWFDSARAIQMLEEAYDAGVSSATLKKAARDTTSWSAWRATMESLLARAGEEG